MRHARVERPTAFPRPWTLEKYGITLGIVNLLHLVSSGLSLSRGLQTSRWRRRGVGLQETIRDDNQLTAPSRRDWVDSG